MLPYWFFRSWFSRVCEKSTFHRPSGATEFDAVVLLEQTHGVGNRVDDGGRGDGKGAGSRLALRKEGGAGGKRDERNYIIRDFFRFSWSAGFPSLIASLLGSADSERGASVVE